MKKKKIFKVFKRAVSKIWRTIKMPEMQVLPGQLAFFFVLSVVPMIALLGYVGIYFSLSTAQVQDFINQSFPGGVADLLMPVLSGETFNTNMILFLVTSFVLASNGAYSIIIISNNLYKVRSTSSLKGRIKSIFITFVIVFLIIFTLLVPTLGSIILESIGKIGTLSSVMDQIIYIFELVKWPISLLFIYFNIKLIYTMAPDIEVKSKDVTKGALFTTILGVLSANLYSTYLSTFTQYDIFYGSISNVIILLLWVYLLSYIFVMGLALNTIDRQENIEVS